MYDRSWLIGESIGTLRRTLIEESIVVSLVISLFLFPLRSALIPILALPIAVVASFIPMYYLDSQLQYHVVGGIAARRKGGAARRATMASRPQASG